MGLVDQRAAFRFPTDLRADCRMAGRSWESRLCNISTTGCMMICPEDGLPDGWMLRLRVRTLPAIDAEIVWQHRGHAGLKFLVPLRSDSMEHLGFHLPDTTHGRPPPLRPHQLPEPAGLHAQLVKRGVVPETLPDSSSPKALVR
uniref:PilZ domain-containing protein n=1 Tax=Altererythrobacter segetis TaxID=1104773 RepID=UPI00140BE0E1|nr:PilZ domain-containing protein [Altererythrobacter segetis]